MLGFLDVQWYNVLGYIKSSHLKFNCRAKPLRVGRSSSVEPDILIKLNSEQFDSVFIGGSSLVGIWGHRYVIGGPNKSNRKARWCTSSIKLKAITIDMKSIGSLYEETNLTLMHYFLNINKVNLWTWVRSLSSQPVKMLHTLHLTSHFVELNINIM